MYMQLYRGAQINFGDLTPYLTYTVKKVIDFPVPGMSLTKLSLAGNDLIIPGQRKFG